MTSLRAGGSAEPKTPYAEPGGAPRTHPNQAESAGRISGPAHRPVFAQPDAGHGSGPRPLIYSCQSRDILIVHVNAIERPDKPTSACDIMNRINEISFNSSLMREMRAINFVTKLIDDGKVVDNGLRRLLVHSISADEVMVKLGVSSKMNADWDFLLHLNEAGRACAETWIAASFDRLGRESTTDIRQQYL